MANPTGLGNSRPITQQPQSENCCPPLGNQPNGRWVRQRFPAPCVDYCMPAAPTTEASASSETLLWLNACVNVSNIADRPHSAAPQANVSEILEANQQAQDEQAEQAEGSSSSPPLGPKPKGICGYTGVLPWLGVHLPSVLVANASGGLLATNAGLTGAAAIAPFAVGNAAACAASVVALDRAGLWPNTPCNGVLCCPQSNMVQHLQEDISEPIVMPPETHENMSYQPDTEENSTSSASSLSFSSSPMQLRNNGRLDFGDSQGGSSSTNGQEETKL